MFGPRIYYLLLIFTFWRICVTQMSLDLVLHLPLLLLLLLFNLGSLLLDITYIRTWHDMLEIELTRSVHEYFVASMRIGGNKFSFTLASIKMDFILIQRHNSNVQILIGIFIIEIIIWIGFVMNLWIYWLLCLTCSANKLKNPIKLQWRREKCNGDSHLSYGNFNAFLASSSFSSKLILNVARLSGSIEGSATAFFVSPALRSFTDTS